MAVKSKVGWSNSWCLYYLLSLGVVVGGPGDVDVMLES